MSEDPDIRPLPHCEQSEKFVLSRMMNDEGIREEIVLDEDVFYLARNQVIFRRLKEMRVFDVGLLVSRLHDLGELDSIGGPGYLSELFTYARREDIEPRLERLRNRHARRMQIRLGCNAVSAAYDLTDEDGFTNVLAEPVTAIFDAMAGIRRTDTPKAMALQFTERWESRVTGKEQEPPIPTGINEIDRPLKGIPPAHYWIISGRSGSGKSSLASQIGVNISISGVPVLYLALERTTDTIYDRAVIQLADVHHGVVTDPLRFAEMRGESLPQRGEMTAVKTAAMRLADAPWYLRKPENRRLGTIVAEIRRHVRLYGVKVVMLDQIGLVKGSRQKGDTEEVEKRGVSNTLQELAHEMGFALVVLSQITDDGDTKGARAIEEDADAHLMIVQERDRKKENFGEHQHVLIAKDSHHSKTGERLPLILDHETVRFIRGFPRPKEEKKRGRFN